MIKIELELAEAKILMEELEIIVESYDEAVENNYLYSEILALQEGSKMLNKIRQAIQEGILNESSNCSRA